MAAVIVLLAASISYVKLSPGKYDDFAKCLSDKGIIMAGTDWCHFCQEQKGLFGKSFKFINYKNCDIEKEWCSSNSVKNYPAWIFPDGTRQIGVQKLTALSQASGCGIK